MYRVVGMLAAVVFISATGCSRRAQCDLAAHKWKQNTPGGCAESFWTFTPAGNGVWNATEAGCASATGTAKYDGVTLVVDLEFAGRTARYEWPLDSQCRGGVGKAMATSGLNGPPSGGSSPSTLSMQ